MTVLKGWKTAVVVGSVGALAISTTRCTADRPTVDLAQVGVPHAAITDAARGRASAALVKMRWVGKSHSDMMALLLPAKQRLVRSKRVKMREKCAEFWRIEREYVPTLGESRSSDPAAVAAAAEAVGARYGCTEPSGLRAAIDAVANRSSREGMSVYSLRRLLQATGVWEDYRAPLEAAWDSPSSPEAVEAATIQVLNQAAADNIPEADLEYVAAAASVSIASAYDWWAYGQGGGFEPPPGEDPMSMYQGSWLTKFGNVGKCDLIGAFFGLLLLGPIGSVVGGFIASAACLAVL